VGFKLTTLVVFYFSVVCLLEGSGQWPEDKDAFRRIKAALHITLGEILSNQHSMPLIT
jgi:U3 small nucleolar RNA-associated protein 22